MTGDREPGSGLIFDIPPQLAQYALPEADRIHPHEENLTEAPRYRWGSQLLRLLKLRKKEL